MELIFFEMSHEVLMSELYRLLREHLVCDIITGYDRW